MIYCGSSLAGSEYRYIQQFCFFLSRDLFFDHSELSSLKSLLAVLSVPRSLKRVDSEASSRTVGSSPCKLLSSASLLVMPSATPWTPSQIEPFLQKIGPSQPVNGMFKNRKLIGCPEICQAGVEPVE